MENKKYKVGIYCRTANKNNQKIKKQEEYLIDICKLLKYENFKVYKDVGFSGRNNKRPAFQEMLQDINDKKISVILTVSIDRTSRNIGDLEYFIRFINEHECYFKSLKDNIDFDTSMGKFFARVITFMDSYGGDLEDE